MRHGYARGQDRTYLVLVLAQFVLLARNQGGNVGLEQQAALVEGEGQPVNGGRRQAQGCCVGHKGRVRVEVRHGDHGGSEPIWRPDDTSSRGRLRAACQYPGCMMHDACWAEGVTWGSRRRNVPGPGM